MRVLPFAFHGGSKLRDMFNIYADVPQRPLPGVARETIR